jgi:hypothetical protein
MSEKNLFVEIGGRVITRPESKEKFANFLTQPDTISLPWSTQTDVFFEKKDIDHKRASKIYPYKLAVIDVSNGNAIVGENPNPLPNSEAARKQGLNTPKDLPEEYLESRLESGGLLFSLQKKNKWEITLPITPQQLNTTDIFSIITTPTARGIVEEHNGVVFKNISVSGTTGVWPSRSAFPDPNASSGNNSPFGITLFGGTIEAAGQVGRAFNNLNQKPLPQSPDPSSFSSGLQYETGYYQAEQLQQFLEQYAIAKKDPKNKNWRLVWWTPKTNEALVVTPVQFSLTKSQASPNEHLYSMQFKAWKRVKVKIGKNEEDKEKEKKVNKLDPNFFQKTITALDNLRSITSSFVNLLKAVRSDFRKPFDQLRKLTLYVKDFAGIAVTLADLPAAIGRDITSATEKRISDLESARQILSRSNSTQTRSEKKTEQAFSSIKSLSQQNEGLSADDVSRGLNGVAAKNARETNSLNRIYTQPEEYFDFFNSIEIDSLSLTQQQRNRISEEIELNSLLSIEEIREIIQDIQSLALDISNIYGAGDELFSKLYNRPAPRKRALPMSVEEFEFLAAIEEAVLQANLLISDRQIEDSRTQNSLEYVGGLAAESEININTTSTSKFLAPVPFGLNTEQIAARYLGNPDRWIEIATLNNLRSPYIDEDGFFYNFLSNGEDRQFTISTKENLFVGQKIQLSSNTVPVFTRKITDIKRISEFSYLITVDGAANLNQLKIADQAKLKAFLPGTINSQNQIFIPSDEFLLNQPRDFDIPYLKQDTLSGFSKIDWLLSDSGDLVLNSFGEVGLANGITNIVQALKMKISTSKGGILSAPQFGSGISPGVLSSEIIPGEILNSLRNTIISDSRFSAVERIEISVLPPVLSINIQATLANGRGLFPINFSVPM